VRQRAKEGVAVLLSDRMWECMMEHKEVSSRMMWVKLKVGGIKLVVVSAYGPGSERGDEEREYIWTELNECIEGFGANVRVVVLGDLNARIGNQEVDGICGKHGVEGVNESVIQLLEMYAEINMVVDNTWFRKKKINKYTWVRDNGSNRALMDYVLVRRSMKRNLRDVYIHFRGMAKGISDHFLVVARLEINVWIRDRQHTGKTVLRVNALKYDRKAEEYKELMNERYTLVSEEMGSIDEEWESFRDAMLECAEGICGRRRLGERKKRSEWWDERLREHIKCKRNAFENWLQVRTDENRRKYKEVSKSVKMRQTINVV
jgi:endonuclease/exonuclease/phosphatase family metal-dependent hydrolase